MKAQLMIKKALGLPRVELAGFKIGVLAKAIGLLLIVQNFQIRLG